MIILGYRKREVRCEISAASTGASTVRPLNFELGDQHRELPTPRPRPVNLTFEERTVDVVDVEALGFAADSYPWRRAALAAPLAADPGRRCILSILVSKVAIFSVCCLDGSAAIHSRSPNSRSPSCAPL